MRLSFWLLLFMFSSSHAQTSSLIDQEKQTFDINKVSKGSIFDKMTSNSSKSHVGFEISASRKNFVKVLNSITLDLDVSSLYETDLTTNQNKITRDGEKLRTTLCSSLEGMLSSGEGASTFGLKASMTGLSNYTNINLGAGTSTSLLLPQVVKVAQRVENEYRNKHCADQPINCFRDEGLDGRSIDSGYFRDLCEDAFTYQFEPSGQPIDTIISANNLKSIEKAFKKFKLNSLSIEQAGCRDKKNCYFLSDQGSAKTCDLLECSLSSGLSSQPAMQLGQMMTFGSPLINFQSSNTTLCNDCFQKAHDVQSNGDFHRKKEKAKKLVQDQLAAKAAAKSLEALKQHAQTMFDMESLTPSGQGSSYCQSQLSQSLSDKTCSGQISEKQFQDRLSLSLSEAGLAESSDPGDIAQSVLNSINPKSRPGNTCTRKDFARQKKIDFDLPQNIKYKSALKSLLDDVSVRSEVASIFTKENCENPGDKSFVDAYSEKIAQAAWDELSPLIKEEIRVGSSTNIFEGVCSKATGFFSKKICGDDGELFGLMAQQNKFAALTYQQEFPELISDPSAHNFSNFETFMTDMIKSNISSAFYVPMEMNPYLKVGLNDWEVMCESQKKLSSGKDITASVFGDLLDVGNGYMGDPVIDKFNQNECNKIATQFSESICSDPELLSNDPRDTEKNLAEIERIKSNILKNDEVDGFAMNSVVCEVKANARQLGDDTNTSRSSPISTQDLLAGGLDFDNYSGCSDETRTFQAASLGLPLIDEKGHQNFVYVPTKESYKAQRSSMLKTAASTFKNSASNKFKMALENKEQVASSPTKRVVKKIPAKASTTRQAQAMPVGRISQTTTSTFEGERNIASNPTSSNTEDCGADCIKHSPVSSRIVMSDFEKKFAMSPNSKAVVAAPSNDERTKKLFEEILSGKLDNNELEQMKKENLALKEEIGKVKDKLASEEVPTRVLDSNGNDRTSYIPEPAKSSAVVYNPRNSSENEFRSRKFFESQRDQITPNFQNAVYSERIPLSEYSKQRRASTDVPLSEVKKFNLEIDKVFLQTVKSDEVDDQFVQEYVQHVNKNSGSIEHLIVYESGMPKAIRVPDPQRPGQYLEHPIEGEMVSTIIKQVEEDEKESYALFNMVNFGDSLVEYMAHIESKESELTTLAAMNHRLKEMKSLEK